MTYVKKWELFKFKVRQSAIHFSKQAKNNILNKEQALMTELDIYFKKDNLTEDEKVKLETVTSGAGPRAMGTERGRWRNW